MRSHKFQQLLAKRPLVLEERLLLQAILRLSVSPHYQTMTPEAIYDELSKAALDEAAKEPKVRAR